MLRFIFSRLVALFLLIVMLYCNDVYARAGGGGTGGGGFGGGFHGGRAGGDPYSLIYIIAGFLVVVGLCLLLYKMLIRWRIRRSRFLLEKLSQEEWLWDEKAIRERVEEVFNKVQRAWMERDNLLAADCLTDGLERLFDEEYDYRRASHTKNILENITLIDCAVLGVKNRSGTERDELEVLVTGSLIDYVINEYTGRILAGNQTEPVVFKELWKFIRQNDKWVLWLIDDNVEFLDIVAMRNTNKG